MRRLILLIVTLLVMPLCAVTAQGQDVSQVTMRTGAHATYTRLVFDWPRPVGYDVAQLAPGQIEVRFDVASSLVRGTTEHGADSNILAVQQVSDTGTPLRALVETPQGSGFRHFTVGSRVVIDVFNPPGVGPRAVARAAPPPAPSPEPELQASSPAVPAAPAPPVAARPVTAVEEETLAGETGAEDTEPAEPAEPPILEQAQAIMAPHVITVTATETVGMAVFRRFDYLWLVLDRPTLNVPPQVAGEQADSFGAFERYELKGGAAYRVKLPPGHEAMDIYGEGGGLVWRVVITPNSRDAEPLEMTRTYSRNQQVRGGAVNWPFLLTTEVLDLPDPAVGDVLKVVTVEQADQFAGAPQRLVDFNTLESAIGLVLQPLIDDLDVALTGSGVEVGRQGGLALSPVKDINRRLIRRDVQENSIADEAPAEGEGLRRIFDFDRWMMGGLLALEENQRILLSGMAIKDANGRVQDLLTLAKMNLSNDRGQEAIGFLAFAAAELPDLADSPEFRALRGASAALAGKYEMAFRDLFHPVLADYGELDYWRAFILAALEDWRQAAETMPDDFSILVGYTQPLLEKIGVKLAEVALRDGDVQTAEGILAVLQRDRDRLKPWTLAAMDYLKGEAHRQSGEIESARALWQKLADGPDDLHRARAGLAMTMLDLNDGAISTDDAIDRLEGLRYAWRGDEIETRVNFMLGRLYLEADRYLKGFTILRDAAAMSPDADIGNDVTAFMQAEFSDLLLNDTDMTPLDAVELYEEFRELTPVGDDGNRLVQKLAERLAEADLLGRATDLLRHQVDFRLENEEQARVALRLGALLLIDKDSREAMKYLALARDRYAALLEGEARAAKLKEIDLLRARGLSQLNRTEEAIEMLNRFDPDPQVNRLRADIAWQAGLWEDAAEALQDLILDEALDPGRPLTRAQADLLLNRAVSLNLSGNRVALNNMRERYEDQMKRTRHSRLFDVVTRPRQMAIMADRETIEAIVSEVDMFADFLDSYRRDADAVSN